MDARWTKKDRQTFFGYKNHIKQDGKSKLITKYKVTSAEVQTAMQPLHRGMTGKNNRKRGEWKTKFAKKATGINL